MNYYRDVNDLKKKLDVLLAKNNLVCEFQTNSYPITLTVRQNQSPEAQLAIFDTTDGEVSSRDAVLRYSFQTMDGKPSIKTEKRLVIASDLLNKITNLAKKLHAAHVAAYYAERRDPKALELYGDPDASDDAPENEDAED